MSLKKKSVSKKPIAKKSGRSEAREKLREKMKRDAANKDSGMNRSKRTLNLEGYQDVSFFKMTKGRNTIDILPYKITSENHPDVVRKDAAIGDEDYVLDVWVHPFVGAGEDTLLCLKKTYGKKCPVCEEMENLKLNGEATDKVIDHLKPKHKSIFNILDHADEDKGVQIFDVSHFLFTHDLLEEAECGDEFVTFSDLEDGKTIQFRGSSKSFKGTSFLTAKSFVFLDRDELDESILDETYPLDAMLNVMTYEEISDAFFGVDEDDDDDDESDEDDEPKPKKKPLLKKKVKKEDIDDDEDDDDEEDDKPASKKKPLAKKGASSTKKKSDCPEGHKFGIDCDEHDDCSECKKWDDCAEEHDKKEDPDNESEEDDDSDEE